MLDSLCHGSLHVSVVAPDRACQSGSLRVPETVWREDRVAHHGHAQHAIIVEHMAKRPWSVQLAEALHADG
eukprot:13423038-Heterocapsa_arctica.AAC.1